MRPDDVHDPARADTRDPFDHLVVGAGLSGLAYAWRRVREGRRVLILEAAARIAPTPPAIVQGPAPHLERLLEAVPGAGRLEPPACGPLQVRTRSGLRPAAPSTLRRILEHPASLASEMRARLAGERPAGPRALRLLAGGVGEVRQALVDALGSCVRFGVPVTRVRPRGGGRGHAVSETRAGRIRAHEVALDVPAGEQARLLAHDAPHHADVLRAVPYADVADIAIEVVPLRLPPVAGFVFERGLDSRDRIQSAFCLSSPVSEAGSPGLVHVHVRLEDPALTGTADETLGRIALAELDRALGLRLHGHVVGVRHTRSVRPEPGHRRRMAELAADLGGRGLRLLGGSALGDGSDRLASAGVPVPGPLPDGVTIA